MVRQEVFAELPLAANLSHHTTPPLLSVSTRLDPPRQKWCLDTGLRTLCRGRPLNRFFAILGGILVAALAALFIAPAMIDWSRYRGSFEKEATRLLGRNMRVGEHVRLQILPTPSVSFDHVRIADASGHFDTPLLRADAFKMQLAIGPLLTGALVAQDIEMTAPTLRLAVDEDGHGNWLGLGSGAGGRVGDELKGLALNAVHIEHGSVELIGAAGWQSRFEDITGDLDAPGLGGPFRFKGQIANAGKPVDLRFFAAQDTGGKTRVELGWHSVMAGAANFTLNGTIDKLDSIPSLAGTIVAQVPASTGGAALPFEVKATVEATPEIARLNGIDMLFDGGPRPQRLTGSATLNWRDGAASKADLAAVWLDLDKIAGADPTAGPLAAARHLLERLGPETAGLSQAHLTVKLAEAAIGGGTAQNLALAGRVNGQGLVIESLTARLPGLSRLDASGEVTTEGGGKFAGQVRLWGANLGGFANWAVPGTGVSDKGEASGYLIDGAFSADSRHLRADHVRAEVSGTTVTGNIAYAGTEPRVLTISLESGRLDVAQLLDVPLASAALSALLTTPAGTANTTAPALETNSLRALVSGDTHLDLRIGHLITAQGGLRDVSARLDRGNGRVDIPAIDFSTESGLALHVEGALATKAGIAEGQLRLALTAPDGKSLAEAARLAGYTELPAGAAQALAALSPLSLAGRMQIGGTGVEGERLNIDGTANGSHLTFEFDRDSSDADLLGSRLDITAALANGNEGRLLAQIASGLGATLTLPTVSGPGQATLRVSGVPRTSMLTLAAINAASLHASFEGRSSLEDTGGLGLDGAMNIEATAGTTPQALVRLDRVLPPLNGPLKLVAQVRRNAGVLALTNAQVTAAGETLTGEARLDANAAPPKLSATLASSVLRLDKLLAALTLADTAGAHQSPGASAAPVPTVSVWSDSPLDFSSLAGFESRITATAGKAILGQGVEITDANLIAVTAPGALDLTLSQGHFARGDVAGLAKLSKQTAGATLSLTAQLTGAQLDGLASGAAGLPKPQGLFGLSFKTQSQGLSMRDLALAAAGSGEFSLSEGDIDGLSPLTADTAARALLADASPAVVPAVLEQRLNAARLTASFPMLGARGAIAIAEGVARFDRLKVQSTKADLEISSRIDLSTLRLSSAFNLSSKSADAAKPALPPVQFTFEGPLAQFAAVTPTIDAAVLTRELAGRKLIGGPEQLAGLWPEAEPAAGGTPVAANPQGPAPKPATAPTAVASVAAGPPPPVPNAATSNTAVAAVAPAPPVAAPTVTAAASVPSQPDRPVPRPRRKKQNWAATLLQGLFGN